MTNPDSMARRSQAIVERIRPILAGKDPAIVSAALGDLLAMWLAGHFASGPKATAALREQLLREHIQLVRDLIGPNEQMILEGVRRGSQ